MIESFLRKIDHVNDMSRDDTASSLASYLGSWRQGRDYFRLDGSTAPEQRKKWCNYFNKPTNQQMRLFFNLDQSRRFWGLIWWPLIASSSSTPRGIPLTTSNPSFAFTDSAKTKPVYIYRFLAKGTMEEKNLRPSSHKTISFRSRSRRTTNRKTFSP